MKVDDFILKNNIFSVNFLFFIFIIFRNLFSDFFFLSCIFKDNFLGRYIILVDSKI